MRAHRFTKRQGGVCDSHEQVRAPREEIEPRRGRERTRQIIRALDAAERVLHRAEARVRHSRKTCLPITTAMHEPE